MKDFLRHNGILILIIAVLLAAITAVASYALKGTANPLSNALGVVTTPIRNGVSSFVGWAEGVYNYSFRYQELEEENQRSCSGKRWDCGPSAATSSSSPPGSPPGPPPTGPPP